MAFILDLKSNFEILVAIVLQMIQRYQVTGSKGSAFRLHSHDGDLLHRPHDITGTNLSITQHV